MMKKHNSRRDFIKNTAIISTGLAIAPSLACKTTKVPSIVKPATYPTADGYVQAPLGYAYNALEPYIDAQTMEIHYTKHHSGYIKNLNKVAFAHGGMMGKSLEELLQRVSTLPDDIQTIVRNNGGGHWNHTFFWQIMTDKPDSQPSDELKKAITKKWGSIDTFKSEFEKAATSRFGSGWAWLVNTSKGLEISSTPNQDNPLMDITDVQGIPLLAIDVWEHAYYLKYQNKRADYLKNWWNVVNWEQVSSLFLK